MKQSHTFRAYDKANLYKIKDGTFHVIVESPLYTKANIVTYDFNNLTKKDICPKKYKNRKHTTFNSYQRAKEYHYQDYNDQIKEYCRDDFYENIDDYVDLKNLFTKLSLKQGTYFDSYLDNEYTLTVWDAVAYVISIGNRIVSVLIDETYGLQSGDCETYVWINGHGDFCSL